MKTKVSILLSIVILLMLVLKPQDVAAQRKKAGQEGSVKRNSYLHNKFHPTAQVLDPACLGGKYQYVVSGFYESIFKVFTIDPTTGKVTEGSRYDAPDGTSTSYSIDIQWLKADSIEVGVIETSMPGGKLGCVGDTVFYKLKVQALDLGLTSADKYFCYGDTLSIESKTGLAPYNVAWYETSASGDINDTTLITSGNKPRLDKVVQSGNYWVVVRDAQGCESWNDLHVKDLPQIGFNYSNTSGNSDNKLANDTVKFYASNDAGTLQVHSDLAADKVKWSSFTPGISTSLADKLSNAEDFTNLDLTYNDVTDPAQFGLKVEVSSQISEVTDAEKYCSTADTLLIYRVNTVTDVTNLYANFIIPDEDGIVANSVYRNWDLSNLQKTYPADYSQMVVVIYDRWGRMVWQSTEGYSENFAGSTNSGTKLPADSYHYVIKKNDGSIGAIGNITIIR